MKHILDETIIDESTQIKELFKFCLAFLNLSSNYLVSDYEIGKNITNYKFLNNFMPKHKFKKLKSDLNKAQKYLNKMLISDEIEFIFIKKLYSIFYNWNHYLMQCHLDHYSKLNDKWKFVGIAFHYIVDPYYHIFAKFLAPRQDMKCPWCSVNLSDSWQILLSQIINKSIPNSYLYISLAQDIFINKDIDVSQYFKNISILTKNYFGIIK